MTNAPNPGPVTSENKVLLRTGDLLRDPFGALVQFRGFKSRASFDWGGAHLLRADLSSALVEDMRGANWFDGFSFVERPYPPAAPIVADGGE